MRVYRDRPVLLVAMILAAGCSNTSSAPTSDGKPPTAGKGEKPPAAGNGVPMNVSGKFLALGDSYTIGEGVLPKDRWPVQLADALRKKGIDLGEPVILAKTGWSTQDLGYAIDEAKIRVNLNAKTIEPYQLVTLLIGVNNQFRGRSIDEFRTQFAAIVKQAVEFAGGESDRVIILSIPDYGVTPFGKGRRDPARDSREIDEFNDVCRMEAKVARARFVEITAASRKQSSEPTMLVADGLHPSGAMYKSWVEAALPEAEAALGPPKK